MPIVIILVALAILGGIVVVAMGRGGELARDVQEPSMADFQSGADVARYRPPPALLGYDPGSTEFALLQAGRALADRDAEIAWLRGRLRELRPEGQWTDGRLDDPADPPGEGGGELPPARTTGPIGPAGQPASGGDDA